MNGRIDAERILDAFLAPEGDRLPDRVIDAALADIARIPQRRALRVPWRFPTMPVLSRAAGIAAVALVAVVGAAGLIYLNSPGGSGGRPSPSPTQVAAAPSSAPTTAPTAVPTPQPTWDPEDEDSWTTFTSTVYDHTISYPSDWSVEEQATREGESDVFTNPEEVDGDEIAMLVFQVPAPNGSDLTTWEGLEAVALDICAEPSEIACPAAPPTPMCLGEQECQPAIIVLVSDELTPSAYLGDPETGIVTVFAMGREDDFPAAARYGGTVALLKDVLARLDVREPRPGETPH